MLTIKAEVLPGKQRVDSSYNVKLRFTLNRQVKRLSTSLFAKPGDLSKDLKLREGTDIKKQAEELIASYYNKCARLQIELHSYSINDIFELLEKEKIRERGIDFFEFSLHWLDTATIKGAKNYRSALNTLAKYNKGNSLDINSISVTFLEGFKTFLFQCHDEKNKELMAKGKRQTSNRMVSLYLSSIRHLFYEARRKYNDYCLDRILIPRNPFEYFEIPRQEVTRKRAIAATIVRQIATLPYRVNANGQERLCVFNLAKDCFILSFGLIGMNSADLFDCPPITNGEIRYFRTKTRGRRMDNAMMKVKIQDQIQSLIRKYQDSSGKHGFMFYRQYNTAKNFNRAINKGLKEIGNLLGIEDLEFYAARHSWATIALNKCGINKYTVHAALNHIDESMRVTDIYIERDFEIENEANQKVLAYVFEN